MPGHVFSPSLLGFYAVDLKPSFDLNGSWPIDAVEITEEVWAQFAGASSPNGMMLDADENSQPVWVPVPPPPPPSQSELADAMLKAGIQITSISNPTLDGTYPCDAASTAEETGLLVALVAGLQWPNGVAVRVDVDGNAHAFPPDDFKNYCQAKLNFQQTLNTIIGNNQGNLPDQPTVIP